MNVTAESSGMSRSRVWKSSGRGARVICVGARSRAAVDAEHWLSFGVAVNLVLDRVEVRNPQSAPLVAL